MKKLLFYVCIVSVSFLIACNNDPVGEPPTEDTTGKTKQEVMPAAEATALKEHVCTDKCEDGNHFYAHGEKGHICTDECMKEHKM